MTTKRHLHGPMLAAALLLAAPAAAQQQGDRTVTLKSFDGFTQLRGELVDFDGARYTISTRLGTLQIDVFQVTCEGDACPANQLFGAEFGIAGSASIAGALVPSLIEGYAETLEATVVRELSASENQRVFRIIHSNEQEMARIDLGSDTIEATFAALAEGRAALGLASRQVEDSEVAALTAAGLADPRDTANESVVALDGLVIIVNQENPIRSISISEVAQIYSGQITNWAQLGGPNMPITAYAREERSGTDDTFRALVLEPNGVEVSPAAIRFESSPDLSDGVANDRTAIGVVGYAYARAARVLPIRQECGLLSFPTTFSIKSEEYPLARRLYMYTTERQAPIHADNIAKFALSDAAAAFIEDAGYVSLRPEGQSLREQGLRLTHAIIAEEEFSLPLMREMLSEFRDAERLSTTFRFTPGSSQLTAKSQRDAEAFARDIIAGKYNGKQILLVGFTDSIGQFELNRALATRRAQGVLFTMNEAVANEAGVAGFSGANIEVQGYGELTPVGCNTTFAGRVANRRVEVWVR